MSPTPESASAEQESRYHTYASHVIPWYVRVIWLFFWVFAIGYVVAYFLPAIQTELLTPP
jgi:uncharacterized membrane protein YagU involved in acid resistance